MLFLPLPPRPPPFPTVFLLSCVMFDEIIAPSMERSATYPTRRGDPDGWTEDYHDGSKTALDGDGGLSEEITPKTTVSQAAQFKVLR